MNNEPSNKKRKGYFYGGQKITKLKMLKAHEKYSTSLRMNEMKTKDNWPKLEQ